MFKYVRKVAFKTAIGITLFNGSASQAADYLIFDKYHTRTDSKTCAQGHYELRDAASKAEIKSIFKEIDAEKRFRHTGGKRSFGPGEVVAVFSYKTSDPSGPIGCTYITYSAVSGKSTADAEIKVRNKHKDYPEEYQTEPTIIKFWNGENVTK